MTIFVKFNTIVSLILIKQYTIIGPEILHTKLKEKFYDWHIEVYLEN